MLNLMKFGTFLLLAAIALAPAQAQLRAPNEAGVRWGHWHFSAKDVDAQTKFWHTLGAVTVQIENVSMIALPGTYIGIKKADNIEPMVGSNTNHAGLYVKDLAASYAKWSAAGIQIEGYKPGGANFFVNGPDGIRVEIYEKKDLDTPVATHHTHFYAADPVAERDWYVKWFGATPGKRGPSDTAQVPGMELAFVASKEPLAPTKGRALDHIGFDVKDLPAFIKKLQDGKSGAIVEGEPRAGRIQGELVCFITDPFGTYIELTQNLEPAKK